MQLGLNCCTLYDVAFKPAARNDSHSVVLQVELKIWMSGWTFTFAVSVGALDALNPVHAEYCKGDALLCKLTAVAT